MSKIPTSLFTRGSKLLGMASKIAFEEASSRLKTWEDEKEKLKSKIIIAKDVVKTLKELKGASMKVGQLLSLDLGDYLPPEVAKILEELHEKSTFLPYEKIKPILQQELGDKFFRLKDITTSPIAAASIGQVHKAKLDGRDIIIKVQYPGVKESIPSDLRVLELILKQMSFILGKSETDLKPFLNEIADTLLKEVDYNHELRMHQKYQHSFKDSVFIIPDVYPDFSTSKVLVQEFISGVNFSQWQEKNPSEELKRIFAENLIKLYLDEIFTHKLVQTDPNPGNFLITPENKMALIDFGAVKEYSQDFVNSYKKILEAAHSKNKEKLLQESFEREFIDPREDDEVKDIYCELMDHLIDPFRRDDFFDFTDPVFFERSRTLSWEMSRKGKYSPPPRDLIFLHRKLAGVFIFIKKLNVKIKLSDYWDYIQK